MKLLPGREAVFLAGGRWPTRFCELEFVERHADSAAAEGDAFGLQAQPLFDELIAAQLDLTAGAHDAMPGESEGGVQHARHQPRRPRETGRLGDRAIGGDFAARYGTDGAKDAGSACQPCVHDARAMGNAILL